MTEPVRFRIPNGFEPRWYQKPFMKYFDEGGRRAVWVMHRRGGKDLTAMHQTNKMAHRRKGMYWHVFPTAEMGRKAIWEGFTKTGERIMEQVFPREIRKSPRAFLPSGEMVVELKCGAIWRLMGSDKMEVVGAGPVGVVFTEFALAKPKTWDLVRPMLRENDGWAAFVSTPRGKNHLKKLYDMAKRDPSWFCDLKTLFDTRAYDPEQTMAEERAEGMPEDLIRQEYLCDWEAANVGAIWGDLVEALSRRGGMEPFDVDPDAIQTSWDLGFTDSTAVWLWRPRRSGAEFVDFYENHGQPLSHYFDWLDERAKEKGYRYAKHWLPHDARARTLATGSSIQDRFVERYGSSAVAIGPALSLLDGIQAVRWILQQDGTRFHPNCEEGLEALKAYRYEYDEDLKTFSRKPVHDWASHPADGMRGAALVVKHVELSTRPAAPEKAKPAPRPGVVLVDDEFLDEAPEVERRIG